MNKILVIDNKIANTNLVEIKDNIVNINKNGEYIVEYINCSDVNFDIYINEYIEVDLFVVSSNNEFKTNITYNLAKNSKVNVCKFYHNNKVEERLELNLNGINSDISYKFSGISKGDENYYVTINHNNSKTKSNVINRLITTVDSKIEFNIDSIVLKNSDNCYTNQDSKIVTMEDNKSIIKPNMYIDNYDVVAKHSSVVGQFREQDLFYMLSRGIDKDKAIKLLVKGYLFSNIDKNMFLRTYVIDIINKYWR